MSFRASESSQHVGRIIDPDVRDDGGLEPIVEFGVPAPVLPPSPPVPPSELPSFEFPSAPELEVLAVPSLDAVERPMRDPEPFTARPVVSTLTAPRIVPPLTPLPPGVKVMIPVVESVASEQIVATHVPVETTDAPSGASSVPKVNHLVDFEGLSDDDPSVRHSRDVELDLVGGGLLGRHRGTPIQEPSTSRMSPNMVAFFGAITGVLTVATIIAIAMRFDHDNWQPAPVVTATQSVGPVESAVPAPTAPTKVRQRNKIPGPYRVKDSVSDSSLRVIEGQIGLEPFLKAVEKAGLPLKEAYRVLKAFEKVRSLDKCAKSDRFAFALDRSTRKVKAFEYILGVEEVFQAREGNDGLLSVEKLDLKIERERVTGAFVVVSAGLERSVVDGGFEPALLRAMREAMTGHMSLDELDRGARVRVIAQEVTVLGEFARYAMIEALEVTFASARKPLRVYYFNGPKSRGYYDETARAPYEGGWRTPIPNARITSKFNLKRMHPVLHVIKPHTGMDFGAAMGTPVGACSFGTVSFMGDGGPCGNTVKIDHAGDIQTGYCHLSRFGEGLKVGDKVTRLQTIGYVGSTGRSTGPHLHFIAKRNGEFIDPESLHLDALRVLPSDERAVFMEHKTQYDARLEAIALPVLPSAPGEAPTSPLPPEGEEDEMESVSADAATGTAMPNSATPSTASPAARNQGGPSLYLTDEDLLRQQDATDNGEVEE